MKKKYKPGCLGHIYQRGHRGFVIFYNIKDSLVFFTIFMLEAEKFGIRVSGLCLMYNHYHVDLEAPGAKAVSMFVSCFCSWFSKEYNRRYGFSGCLFDEYGISNKYGDKDRRTAYAYLYNNPVEWHFCHRAEQYQWNFLGYARNKHPFSERIASRNITRGLRKSIELVRYLHSLKRPVLYDAIDTLLDNLNMNEKRYLTDFIINEYSRIDYQRAIDRYGDYETMVDAFSYNTGSEYDINEDYDPTAGKEYKKMANFLARDTRYRDIGDVVRRPAEERLYYLSELVTKCNVSVEHAMKFLRIGKAETIEAEITSC